MPICEMCGKEGNLISAEIEGGELSVCSGCSKYGTVKKKSYGPGAFSSGYKGKSFSKQQNKPEFRIVRNYSRLIRNAREQKGMTQEEFANSLNEKESILAKWESGTLKPRLNIARQLERLLNLVLVEKDVMGSVELDDKKKKGPSDELTLGDFIKVRKRK
jgi:putative transcription factor